VVVVEHGAKPSRELIERANGIRERWIDYWATTTGHRSSMTANSRGEEPATKAPSTADTEELPGKPKP
jgi:hypothetical protein